MRLIQFVQEGRLTVGCVESESQVRVVKGEGGVHALAQRAIAESRSLTEVVEAALSEARVDYAELIEQRRLLAPLTHADPAHCLVTGTGLTHLGSADTRSAMHAAQKVDESELTDSMRMFRMGLEAGKPQAGEVGPQPEWFYKGDGGCVVPPEADIASPTFAQDAGEEPELAGLYVIGEDGTPWRVGYAIGNEFSDHVTERFNYLWLAHSKLRACSYGPELFVGELPDSLEGTSRIVRNGETLWQKPFVTGEANMAHSLANLEHHHFKYANFRRPGDVHVHFFGTATLSFADDVVAEPGDRYEIELETFGRALRNTLTLSPDHGYAAAKPL